MTIDEAVKLKRAVESAITKLVQEFETASGMRVTAIDSERYTTMDGCGQFVGASLTVKLP